VVLDGLLPLTDPGAVFAVLFLLVLLGPLAAERVRLPAVAGLILAGTLVGPNVLGVLGRDTFIVTLGYVGLLYLMFQGGLDLDLDGFRRRPADSVLFGVLTTVIPLAGVAWVAVRFGLSGPAALVVGAALTSHTLLVQPLVARYHLGRNRGMTATLGATLVANLVALVVLAGALATARDAGWGFWVLFAVALVAYAGAVLVLLPRLTRWFFTGLGQDRQVRLTYLLSGLGVAALVARLVGIEPIVGAFLVGVAFNRFVPAGTLIAERVATLGSSLFVPAFLVATGMLLDPVAIVTDPATLLLGAALLAVTAATKWLAAEASGLVLRAGAPERRLMFALTVGQAAGALAAVVVAQDAGLVDRRVVDAVVLVILGAALVAGAVGERAAPLVEPPEEDDAPLGTRVVVPVSNPTTVDALVRVAALVAAPDSGAVVAVNVQPLGVEAGARRAVRELSATAERVALAAGAEVVTAARVDASVLGGVLHTVAEHAGTAVVMGWKGWSSAREGLFGTVIDQIVERSPVPVLVCRPGEVVPGGRVVVVLTVDDLTPAGRRGTTLAFEVARRAARQAQVPRVVLTDRDPERVRGALDELRVPDDVQVVGVERLPGGIVAELVPGDLVVAAVPPTPAALRGEATDLARAAPGHSVVVCVPR
jgi:Kef-type K+ transport system membrane component KefB